MMYVNYLVPGASINQKDRGGGGANALIGWVFLIGGGGTSPAHRIDTPVLWYSFTN